MVFLTPSLQMEKLQIPRELLPEMPPLGEATGGQVELVYRDFKILQSMNRYIPMMMQDFARLENLHE